MCARQQRCSWVRAWVLGCVRIREASVRACLLEPEREMVVDGAWTANGDRTLDGVVQSKRREKRVARWR